MRRTLTLAIATLLLTSCTVSKPAASSEIPEGWNIELTAEQLHILRDSGTEIPFTSDLLNEHRKGTYVTADCGEPVFR